MTVKEIAKNKPDSLIGKAYAFSLKAHAGQKRKTGEPYFNHALATAEVLNEWKLDDATIAAGLLHDTVEDTFVTIDEIKKEFGEEVAFLVDGVTKIGRIKYRGATAKLENLRKMILAISEDLRVVFIKLADRLHNMKTLYALPPQKQKRIALETDEIYAPLAYRLGMQNLSGELQDLAFPYLYPKESAWLKKTAVEHYEKRKNYLAKLKPVVEKELEKNGIKPVAIDFRAKRWSSLYHKLLRYDMDIERIYDLVAMRIIVNTVEDCYATLGIIHKLWPPLPGRIKDYIAMPKPNSYRSLHTTVIGPEQKPVEFQIRTQKMHEENEYGIAAHWIYKQSNKSPSEKKMPAQKIAKEAEWVKQLRNWMNSSFHENGESERKKDFEEFVQSMKIDFFKDRIFAITPKGDVIDLPVGSTPVDFAYQIHSEIGNSCAGAKVNGQFVPLDHTLKSGDLVEIITQKNKKPSEDWLKFVKTSLAKNHIKSALKEKNQSLLAKRTPSKSEIRLVVKDRVGLLKDVSSIIARSHLNIVSINMNQRSGSFPIMKIECDTTDKKKIEKLLVKIKKLNDVKEAGYKLVN